ncbi:hypothetical protein CsSME_00010120 [Camellia sinensis var. sinensis]
MTTRTNMNGHHHHNQTSRPPPPPPPPPPPQSQPPRPRPPHNHRNSHSNDHYYPPPYSSSSSSASLKGCCCCLFLLFSFLALLILAVVLVIVLAVKPKKPQFDLQQVGVQYVGISPNPPSTTATEPSSASVSLNIRLLFTAANDNKVGIKYGESRFTVMYRGIPLGRGVVPGFYQAAAELVRDATLNDRVELRVLGDVGAKIRILGITSPGVQVSIDCAIVISPKKQALTYKQCGFDGLSV